jgi:hypothetical protein
MRFADAGFGLDARARRPRELRARESFVERGETGDRGAEIGEADVAVDEEIHLSVDVRKGVRCLIERAERNRLGVIERRDDHIRDDARDLRIEAVEGDQANPQTDDALDGDEHVLEHLARAIDLPLLALQQGDLFAVFADAREIETEIRLHRLLLEIERGELAADELRDPGGEQRIKGRHPEQQARDHDAENRGVEMGRKAPKDD